MDVRTFFNSERKGETLDVRSVWVRKKSRAGRQTTAVGWSSDTTWRLTNEIWLVTASGGRLTDNGWPVTAGSWPATACLAACTFLNKKKRKKLLVS